MDFAKLANDAAGGTRGGGDDEGFAGLRLADFEEAEVGGEAVDAKEIEEIGVGEERNAGKFLEGALTLAGKDTVFLEAGEAGDFISLFEIRIAGFDDFGEAKARMTSPSWTGGMYWGKSVIQMRMVGSMERYFTLARAWPSETAGRGDSVSWRTSGVMRPVGRLARIHWRLVVGMEEE